MTKLRACPFCSKPPTASSRPETPGGDAAWVAFVACFCGGYSACAHKMGAGDTQEAAEAAAAAAWNGRAGALNDDQIEALANSSEGGEKSDLAKMADLVWICAHSKTNGEALFKLLKFRKQTREQAIRAALAP